MVVKFPRKLVRDVDTQLLSQLRTKELVLRASARVLFGATATATVEASAVPLPDVSNLEFLFPMDLLDGPGGQFVDVGQYARNGTRIGLSEFGAHGELAFAHGQSAELNPRTGTGFGVNNLASPDIIMGLGGQAWTYTLDVFLPVGGPVDQAVYFSTWSEGQANNQNVSGYDFRMTPSGSGPQFVWYQNVGSSSFGNPDPADMQIGAVIPEEKFDDAMHSVVIVSTTGRALTIYLDGVALVENEARPAATGVHGWTGDDRFQYKLLYVNRVKAKNLPFDFGTKRDDVNNTTKMRDFMLWSEQFTADQAETCAVICAANTRMATFLGFSPTYPTPILDPYLLSVNFLGHFNRDAPWVDSIGRHVLTPHGTPSLVAGLFGFALDCHGDSGLTTESSTDWNFGADFTIEVACNAPAGIATSTTVIGNYAGGAAAGAWVFGALPASVYLYVEGAGTVLSHAVGLAPGVTTRFAIARQGSTTRLYRDGVLVDSTATPFAITGASRPLGIGCNSAGNATFFEGWIDEVRVTNGASGRYTGSSYSLNTEPFPLRI